MYIKKRNFLVAILLTMIITMGFTLSFSRFTSVSGKETEQFDKLFETYETIKQGYYQKVDDEKLVEGAVKGMVESLDDPYTSYMNIKESEGFDENISSSFEGIGAEVTEDDGSIVIVSPIKGSPAEKAGLKPKDKILKVDNKSVEGMSVNEAVELIRGKKGTKVHIEIERENVGKLKFTITRDTIPIETVYSEVVEKTIGKIQITKFSEKTGEELADALSDLEDKGVKGIVLDLRQNPGGLMDQAIAMTDMFVAKGKTILQVEARDGSKEVYKAESPAVVRVPVVVVTDKGTASAAEIMAAALHESAGFPIVGEKTFGKGTVQTTKEFDDGSSIKYTIAKWLTPSGKWIHQKGIEPQYKVSLPEYANLPYLNPDKTLKQGDSSPEVKAAEEMMKAIGYRIDADGFFDEQLKNTVLAFQKENQLKQTGEISKETTIKLMDRVREKIVENDTQMKKAIEVLKSEM